MSAELKKTPLADEHVQLGAKMVDFSGWWMPVQYKGLKEEHNCVRNRVGLFDVSHMGEIRVQGPKSLETLEWLTSNHVAKLNAGEAHYSLLPNELGGLVDDIFVYCLVPQEDYLVCVNAANIEKDWAWIQKNNKGAILKNESPEWSQIAVQGPKAPALIEEVTGLPATTLARNRIVSGTFHGSDIMLATTGYTGEAGGEIFVRNAGAAALWRALLEKGQKWGVEPIGLGARDTLRTEMKYSLYGHEIDDHSNPYEAELGWVVKPSAKDFIGKATILAAREKGLSRKLVGYQLKDKGIPRQGYEIYNANGEKLGITTSGTLSPSTDLPIGIAYIAAPYSSVGTEILVDIRGRKAKAQVCPTPFKG